MEQAYLQREPLVGKTVTELATLSDIRIRLYEPWMDAFMQHCENKWMTWVMECVDRDIMLPDLDSFLVFMQGLVTCYAHITLGKLYLRAGAQTDSSRKFMCLCLGECTIPRWCIDMCRELCRPMVSGHTIFIPYLDGFGNTGSVPRMNWVGLGAAQAISFCSELNAYAACVGVDLDAKVVVEEEPLSAPLCVSDGEYDFIDRSTSTWRKSAYYSLVHFRNGTIESAGRVVPPRIAPWEVTRVAVGAVIVRLVDEIPVPGVVEPVMLNMAGMMTSIMSGTTYPDGVNNRLYLFYQMNRNQLFAAWMIQGTSPGVTLPELAKQHATVRGLTSYLKRYPTEEMRSKTPPQSTVRADLTGQRASEAANVERKRKRRHRRGAKGDEKVDTTSAAAQ